MLHSIALTITIWLFLNYIFVEFLWWTKPGLKRQTYFTPRQQVERLKEPDEVMLKP